MNTAFLAKSPFASTLAGESIVIVRDKNNRVQAYLNVCRHRGARFCNQQSGYLKGSIQCHYHAWTYALDDQINDPIVHAFAGTAPYERYNLGQLKVGKSISYDVHANGKLVLENTLECYHCGPMHPELCDLLPAFRASWIDFNGEGTELAENIEAFTITGKASRPSLPGLLPEDIRRYYGILLMPNVFLNLLSDHAVIDTFFPLGPELTRVTCDWLFDLEETRTLT